MDDHCPPYVGSPDSYYHGVQIKKEIYSLSVDQKQIRFIRDSDEGLSFDLSLSEILDAVAEIDRDGRPSLALAVRRPGGTRRMVLSFPAEAGGTDSRDRLERWMAMVGVRNCSPPDHHPSGDAATFPGLVIKGAPFSLTIASTGITLTPHTRGDSVRTFPRSTISYVSARNENGHLPSLLLDIKTSGGIREMILGFPDEAGGAAACEQVIGFIRGIINGERSENSHHTASCSPLVSEVAIKGAPFRAELSDDRITLTPLSGGGALRLFSSEEIIEITPTTRSTGEEAAILAIQTPGGIRQMILSFRGDTGGAAERDRFVETVIGIINTNATHMPDTRKEPRKAPAPGEYPICQRSGLSSGGEICGLLLTSRRLIIYDGDGSRASLKEEFRSSEVIDASPTTDHQGRPAMLISMKSRGDGISRRTFVFDAEDERNSWISLLTAADTPPPMMDHHRDAGGI